MLAAAGGSPRPERAQGALGPSSSSGSKPLSSRDAPAHKECGAARERRSPHDAGPACVSALRAGALMAVCRSLRTRSGARSWEKGHSRAPQSVLCAAAWTRWAWTAGSGALHTYMYAYMRRWQGSWERGRFEIWRSKKSRLSGASRAIGAWDKATPFLAGPFFVTASRVCIVEYERISGVFINPVAPLRHADGRRPHPRGESRSSAP